MNSVEALEVLTGVMASDAHVNQRYSILSSYFSVSQSGSIHNDWLLVIKDALVSLGVKVSPIYPRVYHYVSKGKLYEHCVVQSLTSPFVAGIRSKWYPKGIKEIPKRFGLTDLSLAHMFMGDGCASFWDSGGATGVHLTLATCGFCEESINIAEEALRGIGIVHIGREINRRTENGSGISINVHQEDVNKFMALVEPYMVPSYKYKVKYRST